MSDSKSQLVIHFDMYGLVRYLSHRETMDMMARSLTRAEIPVAYSQGFNPRPRLSLPLPRTTGVETRGDLLLAVLARPEEISCEDMHRRLARQLPAGCTIQNAEIETPARKWYPDRVEYRLGLNNTNELSMSTDRQAIDAKVRSLLKQEQIEVLRNSPKRPKPKAFDIRPYLERLEVTPAGIEALCTVSQQGTVKVSELLAVLGIPKSRLDVPIVRTAMTWRWN